MRKRGSPLDVMALAFAVALGLLAFGQWRAARAFSEQAQSVEARVVEVRTSKRHFMEGAPESFARVAFATDDGDEVTAELPTSLRALGLSEVTEGDLIPVRYDAEDPRRVRYGSAGDRAPGESGAYVLLALAAGALFIPAILRRSSLASTLGGG